MFERFTERARHVVLAEDEARALKHNYIGTEHLLLGRAGVEDGLAAQVLASLDVALAAVRAEVALIVGEGGWELISVVQEGGAVRAILERRRRASA